MNRQAVVTDKENSLRASGKIFGTLFRTSKTSKEVTTASGHQPLAELRGSRHEPSAQSILQSSSSIVSSPPVPEASSKPSQLTLDVPKLSSSLLTRFKRKDIPKHVEAVANGDLSRMSSPFPAAQSAVQASSSSSYGLARASQHAQHHDAASDPSDVEMSPSALGSSHVRKPAQVRLSLQCQRFLSRSSTTNPA